MALNASFGIGSGLRRAIAKARVATVHLIYERTILLLAVMLCAGVAATLWHLSRLSSTLVKSGAVQGTSLYAESLTELRTFYGSEIVERVRRHGIEVTHDYATKDRAIPIPATFSIEFGKHISKRASGMQVRLYSDYPFPFRKDGGPRDSFEEQALRELRKQPGKPFFRFEDFQGRPSLRYGTTVTMNAGCVACHNTHPESPKTDWKVGDVRGVQEIIRPLDDVMAETRAGLQDTFVLLSSMGLLGLGGLALVFGSMRQGSAELEQKVAERMIAEARLAALHEINVAVTSSLDLEIALKVLMEKIDAFLPYSAVHVWLMNPESGMLERAACRNVDEAQWKGRKLSTTPALVKEAMSTKAPVVATNVQTDPRTLDPEFYRRQGFISYLGTPFVIKGEVLGVLVCLTREERQFSASDIEFLSALANQAAVAIHNSQLFEQTRKQAIKLEIANTAKDELLEVMARQKEELSRLNAGLECEIAERGRAKAEIAAKNRDLETLLYVTSHDLREPLRAIENFSRIVNDRYKDRLDEKGQDFLRRIIHGGQRLNRLLDDILTLSRSQRMGVPTDVVDGESIVLEALRRLEGKINATNAQIRVTKDFHGLRVDKTWATQAVYNLIANALKFTRNGEPPDVEIVPYQRGGPGSNVVGIAVRDRGPGVPPEHAERIFQLFQRAVGREVEGTGAGLAIVRQIAERHGGSAWVESREGGGSEFIITFAPAKDLEGGNHYEHSTDGDPARRG
jgi:signal transduction histidine kinase